MLTDKMLCKCGFWSTFFILIVSTISSAQLIKDDLVIVIPHTGMPADDFRLAADHRRQRNATRLVGTLRRTSILPPDHRVVAAAEVPENSESSISRLKKKVKHKRMWDEPETQASEVQNATSKRPDRIKTRRRLIAPLSSTARAVRTPPAVSRDDPYYDFGKKIKHARQPSSSTTVGLLNALDPMETRTSVKSPVTAAGIAEEKDGREAVVDVVIVANDRSSTVGRNVNNASRTRTPSNRNHHNSSTPNRRPPDAGGGGIPAECSYPRFTRRNKSPRSQRDVMRCLPAEPEARTTRILSTVVTSVSAKGEKNETSLAESSAGLSGDGDRGDDARVDERSTTVSAALITARPESASSLHPMYLRNQYRNVKNITLPEYLEITKVNQRRSNGGGTTTVTAETVRPTTASEAFRSTAAEAQTSTVVRSTVSETSSFSASTIIATDYSTETIDTSSPADTTTPSPPTDLQDFIYLNNGTAETPPADTTAVGGGVTAVEARHRRPPPPPTLRNVTGPAAPSTEHDVGVVYPEGLAVSTYLLSFLAIVPLVLVILFAFRLAIRRNRKKVFDSSEYSSEYNRSPLDFNTVTSSPITTKLPRVPQHIVWGDGAMEKTPPPMPSPGNSRWEFPRDKLRLQTILGQGNFGQVWKAEADDISGHEGLTRLVAVKMVKEDAASREREDLIRELSIMQHLGSHQNVVTLLGCCTEKEPYLLIMEYVMYGKLLAFLRDRRTRSHYFNFSDSTASLTSRDLTVFAYCVARGMDFLVSKKIVHRDLAARNILVDHNKLCKIADFGMSRNVRDTNQIYEQRHTKGALPIRWMAPESLYYSIFTYKTDVWSFGVLMWEIVTLGSTPYCTMGAREVMRRVREGYRLDKPAHCRSELFRVITKCWAADPSKRPTFSELKQELGALLENPEFEGSYVDLESLVDESDSNTKDRQ